MFDAPEYYSLKAKSQYPMKVLLGKRDDEGDEVAPYPLVVVPYEGHHGAFDLMMSQYTLNGYKNLSVTTDAYLVI